MINRIAALFRCSNRQFQVLFQALLTDIFVKALRTQRYLDLLFVGKNAEGAVVVIEYDELEELAAFAGLDGEVGGIISDEDVAHVADALEPGSSAALLIWEDVWASEFAVAVRESGGVLLQGARIPYEIVEAVFANHEEMMVVHPAAAETRPGNFTRNTFLPYHAGATEWYHRKAAVGVVRGD